MDTDLVSLRDATGDEAAFGELVAPYQHELQVHCYRILGSLQDAEDVLQETLLSAWRGLGGFEERASVRTWLYRIATNRSLDALRAGSRREPDVSTRIRGVVPPEPTSYGEVPWLQPFPDALLDLADTAPGPEAVIELREAMSLAFVTALQLLPPRATSGADPARRAGLPRSRGRRHPRHHGGVGDQRAEAGPGHPRREPGPGRQARAAEPARARLPRGAPADRGLPGRLLPSRRRPAGRADDRRRVGQDAADAVRVPRPRCHDRLPPGHRAARGAGHADGARPRERLSGQRHLRARPGHRHLPGTGPLRVRSRRRADQRDHAVRGRA